MLACLSCQISLHPECEIPVDAENCCCPPELLALTEPNKRGGPTKDPEDITDPKSTGRKRAAVLFPIEEGMICEWSKLKSAGGGARPVIGCMGNIASDRHHGPDKNTLNNSEGNVHRICDHCHNRWHAVNDPLYPKERPAGNIPYLPVGDCQPHDPETKATDKEIIHNEIEWHAKGKLRRASD